MVFKTLIHKGAMPIALHAIRSFAAAFGRDGEWRMADGESPPPSPVSALPSPVSDSSFIPSPSSFVLELHSDGSLDADDWGILESAAGPFPTRRVEPEERREALSRKLAGFPLSAKVLERGGYMAKMGVLAAADTPFFYFDSDIVWLRPFDLSSLPSDRTVFSTETWSWYYGIQKPGIWIQEKVPRRVNSGFAWMPEAFPFDRMERMLRDGLYTPDHTYSTDQEMLAFLFPQCGAFALSDFFRTRVGVRYDLATHPAVAVHFPGGMWKPHLDQIESFQSHTKPVRQLPVESPAPLAWPELARMWGLLAIEQNYVLQRAANILRRLLRR